MDVLNEMYVSKRVFPLKFAIHWSENTSINLCLIYAIESCSVATHWLSHTEHVSNIEQCFSYSCDPVLLVLFIKSTQHFIGFIQQSWVVHFQQSKPVSYTRIQQFTAEGSLPSSPYIHIVTHSKWNIQKSFTCKYATFFNIIVRDQGPRLRTHKAGKVALVSKTFEDVFCNDFKRIHSMHHVKGWLFAF